MELQSHGHSHGAVIAWEQARERLNVQYDDYRRIYQSPLNAFRLTPTGRRTLLAPGKIRADPGWAIVSALEVFDDSTQAASKAAIFDQWLVAAERTHQGAETIAEALATSWAKSHSVDVDFVASLLATEPDKILSEMLAGNLVFAVPPSIDTDDIDLDGDVPAEPGLHDDRGRYMPAALYLSGNVRSKLREARAAAAVDALFQPNVDALEEVQPDWLPAELITARLGAVWIDADTITEFLVDEFDAPESTVVEHATIVGKWAIQVPHSARTSIAATAGWGTSHADAYRLVADALNLRATTITYRDADGNTVTLVPETVEANDKRSELEERFADWVWEDPERASRLEALFNERFNSTVLTKWDGSHLASNLAEMTPTFTPHQHQLDAVWRVMASDTSTLLPHRVGAGKTAAMVIAGRQLKRTGQITKPLYVVPNNMLEQFSREFQQLYPTAKLLVATTKDVNKDHRREFIARCAQQDWDAVIMTHQSFKAIPVSVETEKEFVISELTRHDEAAHQALAAGESIAAKEIEKSKARLNTKLKDLLNKPTDLGDVTFETMGVDWVAVDEAHKFKGMSYQTSIPDLSSKSSKMAVDMTMKLDWLRATHGPKVALFATGTPIVNSMSEMWILQRYLVPDLLDEMEMTAFDSWAGTFARAVTKIELLPEGGGFRKTTRIAAFDNVPELLTVFRSFADFLADDALDAIKIPDLVGGQAETIVVPPTEGLSELIASLGERSEAVRSGKVDKTKDNMLVVCSDGRLGSLDLRLIGRDQPAGSGKVDYVAERVAELHHRYSNRVYLDETGAASPKLGAFQLVFCDKGTPGSKRSFNVYAEMKDLLVERGVAAERIAFIHDAGNDDKAKAVLFAACRTGDVSVLIGSTETMGVGTNFHNRLVGLHHVDAPWRPADIEQREGRILRQGNQNNDAHVVRYVTAESFDAYMWQTIERKARFQSQVLAAGEIDPTIRSIDDLENETVLSYAELKAIATGNPLIRSHAEAVAEHARFARLQTNHLKTQNKLPYRISSLDKKIAEHDGIVDRLSRLDTKRVATKGAAFRYNPTSGISLTDRTDAGEELRTQLSELRGNVEWTPLGEIGGQRVLGRWWESRFEEITGFDIGLEGLAELHYSTRDLWDARPHTVMMRLERAIENIPAAIAAATATRADLADQCQRAVTLSSATFAHSDRIIELVHTIEEMEVELDMLDGEELPAAEIPTVGVNETPSVEPPGTPGIEAPSTDPPAPGVDPPIEPPPPEPDMGGGIEL